MKKKKYQNNEMEYILYNNEVINKELTSTWKKSDKITNINHKKLTKLQKLIQHIKNIFYDKHNNN